MRRLRACAVLVSPVLPLTPLPATAEDGTTAARITFARVELRYDPPLTEWTQPHDVTLSAYRPPVPAPPAGYPAPPAVAVSLTCDLAGPASVAFDGITAYPAATGPGEGSLYGGHGALGGALELSGSAVYSDAYATGRYVRATATAAWTTSLVYTPTSAVVVVTLTGIRVDPDGPDAPLAPVGCAGTQVSGTLGSVPSEFAVAGLGSRRALVATVVAGVAGPVDDGAAARPSRPARGS